MAPRCAAALVLLGVVTLAAPARAARGGCAAAIVAESARELGGLAHALAACTRLGRAGAACLADAGVGRARDLAGRRAAAAIAHACCGRDGACGTGDDVTPAALGWSDFCPGLGTAACGNRIRHAGDIASCLACTRAASIEPLAALVPAAPTTDRAARRCARGIGGAATDLAVARAQALARCWRARARGRHANACPEPGDGKAGAALARAAAAASARICAACGGSDAACDGTDDITPAGIGLPATCPVPAVPGAASCARPMVTLADAVACVTCVTAFSGDCADQVAVPAFAPDPPGCHPPSLPCVMGVSCADSAACPRGYACADNGGGTRYCVGPTCAADADCRDGAVCHQYCTFDGCSGRRCQCPGFACAGGGELCLGTDGLACRQLCTQDSDCEDPLGLGVCVNSGFAGGLCIGSRPCF